MDTIEKRPSPLACVDACRQRYAKRMWGHIPVKSSVSVLEVGSTPETGLADLNFFSRKARAKGCEVWVTSPEDCSAMAAENGFHWLPIEAFNSGPKRFGLVISSAVLENVGADRQDKLRHLTALDRASSQMVVVTTPNRYHWMEVHTKLPFLHWLPKSCHRQLLSWIGMKDWANPSHLDLMDFQEFQNLISAAYPGCRVEYRKFRFLGAVSNLMAVVFKE